jgi:hypothetical protein
MIKVRVTIEDVRRAGYCGSGTRVWFKQHSFDLMKFLREGIPAEQFEATGDQFALNLVRLARERSDRSGR